MDGHLDRCVADWMDGYLDGRIDGWIAGWLDGLMDEPTERDERDLPLNSTIRRFSAIVF